MDATGTTAAQNHWSSLNDDELLKSTQYTVNPFRPDRPPDSVTASRISKMLRERLQQYEEQQAEAVRISTARHLAEKIKSERVRNDVAENKARNERAKNRAATKSIGATKVPPDKHEKFYSTISVPDPKYRQRDRVKYGVTAADGLTYKYLDDHEFSRIHGTKLRPASTPGRDSYSLGKERRDLTLGHSINFLEHRTGDTEFFRLYKKKAFGEVPPPGQYYGGHGEEVFQLGTSSYHQRPVPGRTGLPKIGRSERVIMGMSDTASWVNLREVQFKPPPGQYHTSQAVKNASYALSHTENDPSRLRSPMADGFTLQSAPRDLLPSEAMIQERSVRRKENIDKYCIHGHPREGSPARKEKYQEELSARLKMRSERRWTLTPGTPYVRPDSPLPETSFYRSGKLAAQAEPLT